MNLFVNKLLNHPYARHVLIGLSIPFTLGLCYYAGKSSVKVDRASVCAPIVEDQKLLRSQLLTLEVELNSCKTKKCDGCFIDCEASCNKRLESQLEEIKRLRCAVCK